MNYLDLSRATLQPQFQKQSKSIQNPPAPLQLSFSQVDFAARVEQEFVEGSTIAPDLYRAAIQLARDTDTLPGEEAAYPIHDALNWKVTRFGYQARRNLYAALFLNEDRTCWQAKLSHPRFDAKGKTQKYETPVGNGSRAYLPSIPASIRKQISDRYSVEVPLEGSFWEWLQKNPAIPRIWTEGGKKSLCLLSQGYVAIALYGANGGYNRLPGDSRALIPEVAKFAVPGTKHVLAFDQDTKESAQRRVFVAQSRFGALLAKEGCEVSIASWNAEQGKGVDDLIVNHSIEAWEAVCAEALPLRHWQIWQKLDHRLTYPASVRLNTADLSTLELKNLPDRGIIAIASPKGSGKTKFISGVVEKHEKALAGGHRIAMIRNLCARLGLGYKGNLDKVSGKFINDCAYTLRVGLCVDSFLSIDPRQFAGCDLILDEVVQVLRHLLTSSTCLRDGKRPALLARFRELMRVARRVIVADADLDNQTLHYLSQLRGDDTPIFLIRNDYKPQGYPVRYIQAPDRTVISGHVISGVRAMDPGKVVFVATDSKGTSKAIARLIAHECPEKRVLLINSETSGGDCEQEFIQNPDAVLARGEYDVVICSPSVATGVSIEIQGIIARVYGIFTGVSSLDADMAQALGRVREPAERVVWCASRGTNFSKISRSVSSLELKSHLQQLTSATVSIIRSSLREDVVGAVEQYDWQTNPHLNLLSRIETDRNFAMYHLRDALLVRLRFEGNQVTVEDQASDPIMGLLLAKARQECKEVDAEALVSIKDLIYSQVLTLEQKESLTVEERLAIAKFYMKDFYCLENLTVDDVLWDNEGRRRGELLSLEAHLFPDVGIDQTSKALEKQASWNQGLCPWDISHAVLRRRIRDTVGLTELIKKMQAGWTWTRYDLVPYATRARVLTPQIKVALHFTITESMSDTQVIHQLLSQLGIKISCHWSRSVAGHEGTKLRVYSLELKHWKKMSAVLQQRQKRREQFDLSAPASSDHSGSPLSLLKLTRGGDPLLPNRSMGSNDWLSPESLADIDELMNMVGDNPITTAEILRLVPRFVLEHLRVVVDYPLPPGSQIIV